MSRYFDAVLPDPCDIVSTTIKPPSTKKLRIKKRNQIRVQNRNLAAKLKVATSNTAENNELKRLPVDKHRIKFYSRGEGLQDIKHIKGRYFQRKFESKEKKIEWATKQSARAEVLLTEEQGLVL